jgi:hypothetical protein
MDAAIKLQESSARRPGLLCKHDRGGPVEEDLAEGLERSLEGLAQMVLLVAETG